MARVTFSPLIAGMSGRTADAVFASWKGRNYVRKHVIPHNPKSDDQKAVRESLARCVTLWRSLSAIVKTWLDTYGVDYRMSGYNTFCQKNRAHEQVPEALEPVPANPHVVAPSTFAGAAGGSGIITFTWVNNAPATYDAILLFARLTAGVVFELPAQVAVTAETYSMSGLDTGQDYDLYGWFYNTTSGAMGTAASDMGVAAG